MSSYLVVRARNKLANERQKIVARRTFTGSAAYWTKRYTDGGNSGIGSYGELAQFKAGVLNALVKDKKLRSVIELGCGDGHQLGLAEYPSYIGLDVAPGAIDLCMSQFSADASKSFFLFDPERFVDHAGIFRADASISLDVIYHLVEDTVFDRYMHILFGAASECVVIYASNEEISHPAPHIRHRAFTTWVEQEIPDWRLDRIVENPRKGQPVGIADFHIYVRKPTDR